MININEKYEEIYTADQEKGINTEMINGRLIRSPFISEEDHRLMFLLGTLFTDYFGTAENMIQPDKFCMIERDIIYGNIKHRVNEETILMFNIMTVRRHRTKTIPEIAVKVMSESNQIYNCLDIPYILRGTEIKEYWLFDTKSRFVYVYNLTRNFSFRKFSYEQTASSFFYPHFSLCVEDVMWKDEYGLKQLAVFYRFNDSIPAVYADKAGRAAYKSAIAETPAQYYTKAPSKYSAETFYEWIKIRRSSLKYRKTAELLMGNIIESDIPAYKTQQIRGNLFFYIKDHIKEHMSDKKIMIYPMEIEMKGKDILDSVVAPDLFLISSEVFFEGNVCKGVPDWVIEIATPSSAYLDYMDKAQIYHYHGVHEYWIINEWKHQVMVLNFDGPTCDDKPIPQFKSTIDKAAGININDLVNTGIFSFEDYIEVKSLNGLFIKLDDIMCIP